MNKIDRHLFWAVLILVLFGAVMVYSASSASCARKFGDPMFFVKRQVVRVLIGAVAMYLAAKIDYHFWQKYSLHGMIAICALLLLPLIPTLAGMGPVKGASRWVKLFGSSALQPSELAKFVLVVFLAEELSKLRQFVNDFKRGLMPILVPVAILLLFIVLQPNFGMVVGLSLVTAAMLLVAGVPYKHFMFLGIPSIVALAGLMIKSEHARERLETFFVGSNALEGGYQIGQSLIALGSGGILGLGLGQSKQKVFYLPEPHTDFIFAVIGEELGLWGTAALVLLFAYVAWRGLKITLRAPDRFGALLAFGLTSIITFFALINLGVVTRLLPTTGIPLPFISYGGSQLVIHMFLIGVLLNISSQARRDVPKVVRETQFLEETCAT